MEYSKKDLAILFELSGNARIPLNAIAKKLKMSQQGLAYKITKWEQNKLILGYFSFIDYACFNYQGYKLLLNLHSLNPEKTEGLLKILYHHPSITSLLEIGGQWDYMVHFTTKNASQCNKDIHSLLEKYSSLIKEYKVLTSVASYEFGRKYLSESTHTGTFILGGDRENYTLTSLEQKILKDLSNNPKIPYVQLAIKYNVTAKTIIGRVKNLETRGILKGYSCVLDCTQYHFFSYKFFLKFINISPEREESFMKFCRNSKNITCVAILFGDWDIEITIEIQGEKELHFFCKKIRSLFSDIIKYYEIYPLLKYEKYSWLPEKLFLDWK